MTVGHGKSRFTHAGRKQRVLAVDAGPAAAPGGEALAVPQHQRESWAERVAIMVIDGGLPHADAERLAWAGLSTPGAAP